jgi:hypothetical protein
MKPILAKLVLPLGILSVAACGARTPLDGLEGEEPGDGAGGLLVGSGGQVGTGTGGRVGSGGGAGGFVGTGGRGGSGGMVGGRGGNVGGSQTGGRISTGGAGGGVVFGGAGGSVRGGAGGSLRGGAGGSLRGGAGGSLRGGAGGSLRGGAGGSLRGGAGGSVVFGGAGGSVVFGGAGGSGAVGGTAATGGTGGTVTTGACQGLASNEELIDDLNDGDRFVPRINGRVGSWTDSHDGTPGGVMSPDPVDPFVPTQTGDPCRKYAAYVKGMGFSDWGANLWFGLGAPYDASKYSGISFWARVDSATSLVLRVAFPDKDTQPDGGICKTNVTGPTACYDHYGTRITLTSSWKKLTLAFKDLSQDGWGLQGTAFDPASLYEVLFEIPVNAAFSIWIDDVAFTM